MGLPQGRPAPGRIPEMGAAESQAAAEVADRALRARTDIGAAGGLWVLALCRVRKRSDPVRRVRADRDGAVHPAPAGRRGRPVHRRFHPRYRRWRTRRDRAAGGHHGPACLRRGPGMVRRRQIRGLSLPARARRGDGRGDGGVHPQADSRRSGIRRRGRPHHRAHAAAGLSRQPLFLRLSRLSQPWRTRPTCCACWRRSRSAWNCPTNSSCIPSRAPRRSCCITQRRSTSRSDRIGGPAAVLTQLQGTDDRPVRSSRRSSSTARPSVRSGSTTTAT